MKNFTTYSTRFSNRLRNIFTTLLTIALIIPAVLPAQQLPVNLGSTSNFAILAGAAVSNVPASAITGDIGLSPAAGSGITGFGAMEITGTVYTVDVSGPAGSVMSPTLLTAAKSDLTIAYNNAAGRTPVPTGAFLNPGSGNIGGLTLVPGLYKFTSNASITGSDVTLSGTSTDVWIFQIAAALNVGNGIHVNLAGGALAKNIFWQVGTSATLGTTTIVKGTIMADQSITIGTGSTLDGRALASSAAVTVASSTITRPSSTSSVETGSMPTEFALLQNYPNPFNPSTMIQYNLEKDVNVVLSVYDMLGNEVATLVNEKQPAGSYSVMFNTNSGKQLSSGVYFYRLNAGPFVSTKKFTLLK